MTVSPGTPTFTPPAYSVPAFTAANVALGGTITTVTLESTAPSTQTNVPFRFGQVFKAGDVAPGDYLVGKVAGSADVPLQFNMLATHLDGSVRHAVVSGVLPSLAAGASVVVSLVRSATGTSLTPIAPSQFILSNGFRVQAKPYFAGVPYTADAGTAITALTTAAARAPGAISTEYNVVVKPKNTSNVVHADLEVRFDAVYFPGAGAFKVDVTFEHTKAFSTTGDLTYSGNIQTGSGIVLSLGGSMVHYPYTRWKHSFWIGNEYPVSVRQNRDYWIDSKAVANYDRSVTIDEDTLAAYADTLLDADFGPMGNGIFTKVMSAVGGRPDIGLLPGYAAATILSMDKRAITLTKACGDVGGSWSIHRRDTSGGPGAGMPLSPVNWPYATTIPSAADTNPATGQNELLPSPASSTSLAAEESHTPNFAYLPYLLTGDLFYLEEMQFWTCGILASFNYAYRQKEKGIVQRNQVRGQAWQLRGIVENGAFCPDSHPLKNHFKYWVDSNITVYDALFTNNPDANKLGVNDTDMPYAMESGASGIAAWQDDHFTSVIGHAVELGYTNALPLLRWKARFQIGRLIDPDWCYADAAFYKMAMCDAGGTKTYDTFAQVKAATIGAWGDGRGTFDAATVAALCGSQQRLDAMNAARAMPSNPYIAGEITGYAYNTDGYPSNLQPALAMAVDSGYTNGDVAWGVFDGRTVKPDYSTSPQFAVVPRGTAMTTPLPVTPPEGTRMPTANLIQETTTSTSAATITLLGKTPGLRGFADGFSVGTTNISVIMTDDAGNTIAGKYTLTSANTLTRTAILDSSAGGTTDITFPAGAKRVYHDLLASDINKFASSVDPLATSLASTATSTVLIEEAGLTKRISSDNFVKANSTDFAAYLAGLPVASSFTDPDSVVIWQGGTLKLATGPVMKSYYGTGAAPAATVTSVTVSPATVSVAGGGSQTFTAAVSGTNSPSQAVTWTTTAGSITSGGGFTAPAATTSAQTITVRATSVADNTKSGTATVTVAAAAAGPVAYQFNGTAFGGSIPSSLTFDGTGAAGITIPTFIIKALGGGSGPDAATTDVYATVSTQGPTGTVPKYGDSEHPTDGARAIGGAGQVFTICAHVGGTDPAYDGYFGNGSNVYTYRTTGGSNPRYVWVLIFNKGDNPASATPIWAGVYDGNHTGTPVQITFTN